MNEIDVLAPAMSKRASRPSFSAAAVHRALVAVAASDGNCSLARRMLEAEDFEISAATLQTWKNKSHAALYQTIRAELLPKIRERQADTHRALERRQLEVSLEAVDLVQERLPRMEDKDLVSAMNKTDIGSGIHGDKSLLLDGQPTQIIQRDASDVIRKLKSRGFDFEAEVIEEDDVTP